MIMDDVTEYCEGLPLEVERDDETDTIVLRAFRESGMMCVAIDIKELLCWFRKHRNWEHMIE